jgi:aromatic-L-amino-acid decarboxylase
LAALQGLDQVDSLCVNAHKWLLVNFDCSLLYVAQRAQIIRALGLTPE